MPLLTANSNRELVNVEEAPRIPVGQDTDEASWRTLGQGTKQDLQPVDQELQAKLGRFNYTKSLVGHRLVELMRDYVIGGDVGIRIRAKDPTVQEILMEHWKDPFNDWERRLPQDVLDLSQDGELLVPMDVSEGHVFAGKIDPTIIKKVTPEPFYCGRMQSVEVAGAPGSKDKELAIISIDREPNSDTFRRRQGDAYFWTVNKPSGGSRGIGDLFALHDFIDQLDRFLFSRARNAELQNYYIWDVTLKGATDPQVKQFLTDLRNDPPVPGSYRVHNDQVAWNTVRPGVGANDASKEMEAMMSYILFGFGIPPTATGIISTGRTALSEQIDLLYKTFSSRAREVRNIVTDVLNFVIDQAILSGRLKGNVDTKFSVVLPRIALRDIQRTGGALSRVGDFFKNMEEMGIYNQRDVRDMLDIFLSALGFDVPELPQGFAGYSPGAGEEEEEEEEEEKGEDVPVGLR